MLENDKNTEEGHNFCSVLLCCENQWNSLFLTLSWFDSDLPHAKFHVLTGSVPAHDVPDTPQPAGPDQLALPDQPDGDQVTQISGHRSQWGEGLRAAAVLIPAAWFMMITFTTAAMLTHTHTHTHDIDRCRSSDVLLTTRSSSWLIVDQHCIYIKYFSLKQL